MPYTTQAELAARYGTELLVQLTDRAAVATGTIDADVVTRAIADADARIDAAVKLRYVLPLSPVPAVIGEISRRITIYTLHVFEPSEKIVRDYKDALADLDRIGKGTLQLDAAGVEPATTGGGGARVTDRERPFTADSMKGWIGCWPR